jgi:hypothetical protein
MGAEFGKVFRRWVAFMLCESIFGIEAVVTDHYPVALDFGNDARRRDTQADAVPADQRGLRAGKIPHGQAVDQDVCGERIKGRKGPTHRFMRGPKDVEAVDFGGLQMARRPANAAV